MNSRSIVLDSGNIALLKALGQGTSIPVGRFRVGSSYNYDVNPGMTNPGGTLVYTGYNDKISLEIQNTNELKVTINLTDDIGPFTIGNIVLDLYVEGVYIPFLLWVSDIPIPKYAFNSETGDIGNILRIGFTEEIQNIDEALDINVIPTLYASLPQYSNIGSLPPASSALYQTFTIQTHSQLYRPIIGARRAVDNTYFGYPLLARVDDPFFGVRDGGIVGFNLAPFTGTWLWGGYLDMDDEDFAGTIDGGTLLNKDEDYGTVYTGVPINNGAL